MLPSSPPTSPPEGKAPPQKDSAIKFQLTLNKRLKRYNKFMTEFAGEHHLRHTPDFREFDPVKTVRVIASCMKVLVRSLPLLQMRTRNFITKVRKIQRWYRRCLRTCNRNLLELYQKWIETEDFRRKTLKAKIYKDCRTRVCQTRMDIQSLVKMHCSDDTKMKTILLLYWNKREPFLKRFHSWYVAVHEMEIKIDRLSRNSIYSFDANARIDVLKREFASLRNSKPNFQFSTKTITTQELVATLPKVTKTDTLMPAFAMSSLRMKAFIPLLTRIPSADDEVAELSGFDATATTVTTAILSDDLPSNLPELSPFVNNSGLEPRLRRPATATSASAPTSRRQPSPIPFNLKHQLDAHPQKRPQTPEPFSTTHLDSCFSHTPSGAAMRRASQRRRDATGGISGNSSPRSTRKNNNGVVRSTSATALTMLWPPASPIDLRPPSSKNLSNFVSSSDTEDDEDDRWWMSAFFGPTSTSTSTSASSPAASPKLGRSLMIKPMTADATAASSSKYNVQPPHQRFMVLNDQSIDFGGGGGYSQLGSRPASRNGGGFVEGREVAPTSVLASQKKEASLPPFSPTTALSQKRPPLARVRNRIHPITPQDLRD